MRESPGPGMPAEHVATHLQNYYVVCATAIPALFVAVVVQPRDEPKTDGSPFRRVPFRKFYWFYGLFLMAVGQVFSMLALALDMNWNYLPTLAGQGVAAGVAYRRQPGSPPGPDDLSPLALRLLHPV
jgi:hypothetical protein